jgi:hypothetical protein
MVLIGVYFVDDDFWAIALYLSDFELEVTLHTALEDLTTVFGGDNQVVPGVEDGVTSPVVFHTSSVRFDEDSEGYSSTASRP